MAELYDQVKQSNSKYVPKFIGSNFDTLKAVGDTLEDRYKRTKDLSDSLAIQIANDRYFDKDKHIGEKHYQNLANIIHEVSSSDQNFENSGQVISQAIKDYATDRSSIAALDNAKRYQEYLDLKHKLGAEAVDFTERKNQNFFNKGTVDESGNLNRFEHALEKRLDYNIPKEKLFNDIEPDLIPYMSQYNPKTGQIEGRIDETNKAKIRNYLGQAFNRYKQDASSEYNQEKEVLRNQGIPESKIDAYIAKSIADVGQEKVLERTRLSGENASHQFLAGLFPSNEEVPFVPTSPGSPKVNTSLTDLVDNTNTKREMTEQEKQEFLKNNASGGFQLPVGSGVPLIFPKMEVKGIPKDQKGSYAYQFNHIVNNASERQKQLTPRNEEVFKKDFELAKENSKNITESGEQLTKENSPIYENYLKGAALNSPTLAEGESEPKILREVIRDLNLSKSDKLELVPTLLNRTSPNSKLGANIEGQIYVNGQPIKAFATRLSDQFDSASTELNDILQNSIYKGSDTYTKEQPKVSSSIIKTDKGDFAPVYYTTTIPINGKFDTEVHVGVSKIGGYQPDGTPIIEKPEFMGETYTAQEFKAKQTEISKRRLKNVYGSGQMKEQDLKSFATE